MLLSGVHYCCLGNCTHYTQAANQVKALYNLFTKVDATQVEINPFGETPDGKGTLFLSYFLLDLNCLTLFSPLIFFSFLLLFTVLHLPTLSGVFRCKDQL